MATNDDYLRELQEKIRRLEFDRLPHEVATKLIEESIEKGTKLRREFKKAKATHPENKNRSSKCFYKI
jgi:hypothetical protein